MNRNIWLQESFNSKNPLPSWPCPTCSNGFLIKDGESINTANSKETNAAYNPAYTTSALAEFRFTGTLKCNRCGDKVIISGSGKYLDIFSNKHVSAAYRGKKYMDYYPAFFQPALHVIVLPLNLDAVTYELLTNSFRHFWYDLDACANKIRQALEVIVKERGASGKNLDQQIESLRSTLGERTTNRLLALKWIGNEGSHAGRPFEKSEILDAYDLLEDVLAQLYPDHTDEERKDNLVQKIISNKGLKKA